MIPRVLRLVVTFVAVTILTTAQVIGGPVLPANEVKDQINDSFAPDPGSSWVIFSAGWFYTPPISYVLNEVLTVFNHAGVDRTITVELLTAPRADGGVLLRSGDFNSADARGVFGGATFADVLLVAGTQYFVGFRNLSAMGVNLTDNPAATSLGVVRYDFDDSGLYAGSEAACCSAPILQFVGPAPAVVPEPAALLLLGSGLAWLAGTARWRRGRGRKSE